MLVNQLLKLVSPYIEDFLSTLDIDDDPISCWEEYINKDIPEKINTKSVPNKNISKTPEKIEKKVIATKTKTVETTKSPVKTPEKKTIVKKAKVQAKIVEEEKSPSKETKKTVKKQVETVEKKILNFDPTALAKMTVKDLKELCKANNHKQTGKKSELVDRLLGLEDTTAPKEKKVPVKKDKRTEKQIVDDDAKKPVIKKIKEKVEKAISASEDVSDISGSDISNSDVSDISSSEDGAPSGTTNKGKTNTKKVLSADSDKSTFQLRRNKFGNFENLKTGMVVNNPDDQVFIGKQEDGGTISPLTKEDIEFCKLHKLQYNIPPTITTAKQAESKNKDNSSEELNSEDVGESFSSEEESSVEIEG